MISPALLLVPALLQTAPAWDGTYTLQSGQDQIPPAIEKSVAGMNAFTKAIWKKKLEGREKTYDAISLLMGTNLTVNFGKEAPVTIPASGSATWQRSDGETFQVSMLKDGDRVVLSISGDEGQRELAFTLVGGILQEKITVRNPKLAAALEYTLAYRKGQ